MVNRRDGFALSQVRVLFESGTCAGLTDGQLLERFATGDTEAAEMAFTALIERHGAMVLRVCRGLLADPNDAQDAFQATFLVLVRKARGLWVRDSIAPWLHGVAHRTASCARSVAARRMRNERRMAEAAGSAGLADERLGLHPEEEGVLHEELARLPERYRIPLVLCYLVGLTHEQAAQQLRWPVGTVKTRLARGRERLRARLVRRGLAPGVAGVGWLLAAEPAVAVSAALANSTVRAATGFGTGKMTAGLVSATVGRLAREVLRSMTLNELRMALVAAIAGLALAVGAGVAARQAPAPPTRGEPDAPGDDAGGRRGAALRAITGRVREGEKPYENIDVHLSYQYDVGGKKFEKAKVAPGENSMFQAWETQDYEIHFVGQGGRFRTDLEGDIGYAGEKHRADRTRAYDGSVTRFYVKGSHENLIEGKSYENDYAVRPHMLLLRMNSFSSIPLSTYLAGHEAMKADPDALWNDGYTTNVEYKGEEVFEGLKCHSVWITTSAGGAPNDRWELLLAEDRNFIPARLRGYTFRFSRTLPMSEGRVEEWQEPRPGIWFPKRTHVIAFNWDKLARGIREEQWSERYSVEVVSLEPKYEASYFNDVPIPDGTPVHHMKNGEVTKSYVKGAPGAQ